uniref:EGF-like domain-containing protein n=1 Tax=Globodera pallida TaxID=36090 RepID=A0A183BVZ6_GLOPA
MGFSLRIPSRRLPSNFGILICLCFISLARAQNNQPQPTCGANQIFNGQSCACAAGYFDKGSKDRCEDECSEEHQSLFTSGECVQFGRSSKVSAPCNIKCAVRLRLWTIFALFAVISAAVVILALILPMCVINCFSCLHSKKASKHSKRVAIETQQSPSKEQQLQTLSYNPYSYWPYYGR